MKQQVSSCFWPYSRYNPPRKLSSGFQLVAERKVGRLILGVLKDYDNPASRVSALDTS